MSGLIDQIASEGRNMAAKTGLGDKAVAALIGLNAEALNNILTALQQPSLCFIPIKSESLIKRRTVDIGTTMLISQADQKKDYLTDNAAPRPRTWTGSGYISSLSPLLENGLLLKPTVLMQEAVLDAASESRQAVKFKTDTGEVVDVLIQDLQIASTPKGAGVKRVQYTVQEVKVLQNSVLLGDMREVLGSTAVASLPVQAIKNLGRSTLLGAGVAVASTALLNINFAGDYWGQPEWAKVSEEAAEESKDWITGTKVEEPAELNPSSKAYEVKVKEAWEKYGIDHEDVEKTGLIPVTKDLPVETILLNITGTPVLYKYSTFRLADFQGFEVEQPQKDNTTSVEDEDLEVLEEKDARGVTLQHLISVENVNLICTLTFDVDKCSNTYEKWICNLAYIASDDSAEDVPDRSFPVYPNTLHFEGDKLYIVSISSKLSSIGFTDLSDAFITIGVPQNE